MSLQKLYDEVVGGMIKQGAPSLGNNGLCQHRSPQGLKCAVGLLMSDDEYEEKYDAVIYGKDGFPLSSTSDGLYKRYPSFRAFVKSIAEKQRLPVKVVREFMSDVQELHDNSSIRQHWLAYFKEGSKDLAVKYKLSDKIVK